MGKITLGGNIPGDNNDGVGPHSEDLIKEAERRYQQDEPMQIINVVARIAVRKVTIDTVKRIKFPVLGIQHWEVVPAEHQQAFGKIIGDAFGTRTGADELPFPNDEVPIANPFPEEDAAEARAEVEGLENEDAEGEQDELAQPRARARRRTT